MIQPRATYRLQLHAGFTFADATRALPYFAELGISHLYLSPIFTAAAGSTHGYDVVDPERISEALGGEAGFATLVDKARAHGIGLLVDIVPNHMSIASPGAISGHANQWWLDVLENGAASYYAHFFDVDWTVGDDRILLPILGERYGRSLQNGAIRITERFAVRAGDQELPLAPRALGSVLQRAAQRCGSAELAFIGDSLAALPESHDAEARRRRHRDKAVLLGRLAALLHERSCAEAVIAEIASCNADPIALDALLEMQPYRLVHWSVAANQLSYRRFFDINTLVGVRNEDADVFAASHGRTLRLLADGAIDGVRIDHVDGLRDPQAYLARLRAAAPEAWIVVEKILTADETLPASWPIDGTTGYDFIEKVGGLFVDPSAERALTRTFETATGERWQPVIESRRARREVMSDALHSELTRLTELAMRACATSPACRDYTRTEIEAALAEILAGYPTYRTYLNERERHEIDRARIASAVAAARDARPDLDRDLLAFLEAALAFEVPVALELASSAQQLTGAITAKGDEDTVLYRQVRLLARCDVGSELRLFAHAPSVVHHALASAKPRTLLATATHDTKRGEDVRARLAVLSELPDVWAEAVARWRERAARHWQVPADRVIEYALWQTLVGAWPLSLERAKQFALKAAREARLRTSWRKPDEAYEAAVAAWLDAVYADDALLGELQAFVARIEPHGDRNSLAQLLIKLTAPGVPDFYQGSELRDDCLVDPDNRRRVDLDARRAKLRSLSDVTVRSLAGLSAHKLWVIRRVLGFRRAHPEAFAGAYRVLEATGPHAHRVFAFGRGERVLAIVPRLGVHAEAWRGTTIDLPRGTWRDVLTDQSFSGSRPVAALWQLLPVALLASGSTSTTA